MDSKLSGVFAPITTPFTASEDVDLDGLQKNMAVYAKSGLHGYLALGSNGENKSLTTEEKLSVLETIVSRKGENQIVMAGSIFESTRETIQFALECQRLGADYITLLPPSYFKKNMTDEVLHQYFSSVAEAVAIPCLVYNAPQFCGGIVLSAQLLARLSRHPNILGLKDSSKGNIETYLAAVPEDFHVMAGSANFFLDALCAKATGGVISLANIFPDFVLQLHDLFRQGRLAEARAHNEKVLRVNAAVSGQGGVASVKKAMDYAGLCGGLPRKPLLPLSDEQSRALLAHLKDEGLVR